MSFKSGVFTSNSVCTVADLELEAAINKKLPQGRVVCYTIKGGSSDTYGMVFSHIGYARTFTRKVFDLDIDDLIENGLNTTAQGMQNRIGWRWTYDEPSDNAIPRWLEEVLDEAL